MHLSALPGHSRLSCEGQIPRDDDRAGSMPSRSSFLEECIEETGKELQIHSHILLNGVDVRSPAGNPLWGNLANFGHSPQAPAITSKGPNFLPLDKKRGVVYYGTWTSGALT